MSEPELKVALVALNSAGHRSLALGYLRAYAEARKSLAGRVGFVTLDLEAPMDAWWVAYRLAGLKPDVVAFSTAVWNAQAVYDACRVLKASLPEVRIVLGGPEVSPIPEEVLAAHLAVDLVVRGEGERTFAELLDAMLHAEDPTRVRGVSGWRGDELVSAPDQPLIEDLDEIPSPYLEGVMEPFNAGTYLETYRGCPHRCGYCFEGKGYGRIRSFSKRRVEAEIDLVVKAPGMTNFSFIDPVFNLTSDRLAWLAEAMAPHAARGVRLHTVEVDIERIDDEAAALLAKAGVAFVETGPQSTGSEALAACRRGFDAEKFRAGVEACKRAGIAVECDLILGLPGDSTADFVSSFDFIVSLDPGKLQASTLRVLPGTDLWERADEMGLKFDRQPPHEVIETSEASFRELRRAEIMASWVMTEYGAKL